MATGTIPQLPPQFAKLAALYRSSTFEGERATARQKAEAILPPEAGGFERALRIQHYNEVMAKAGTTSLFAGFDEYQEIDNPGHMARQAEARAERQRAEDQHRARLIERYGSLEAVLEPCEREKILRKALKAWRVPGERPHQRWTWELKGWGSLGFVRDMPPEMRAAVERALPMPTTFAEARAELAWWRERNADMEIALGNYGDYGLDRVCVARMELIRDVVEHEMRLDTLSEILERFRIFRDRDNLKEEYLEGALFRDLEALVAREARI